MAVDIAKLANSDLAGTIITWWMTQAEVSLTDVIAALKKAGLPWDNIPKLQMDTAFRRAIAAEKKADKAKKLSLVKVKSRSDDAKTQWQLDVLEEDSGRVDHGFVDSFSLDKASGNVVAEHDGDKAKQVEAETKKQFGTRNQSDITKIVQALMQSNGDLYPINPVKPVAAYFVPIECIAFQEKVELFITELGGGVAPFPIPKGTEKGDKAVREAIGNGMSMVIGDVEAAAAKWTANTRPATMMKQLEELEHALHKGDCYAELLKGDLGALKKTLTAKRAAIEAKMNGINAEREEAKEKKRLEREAEKAGVAPGSPVENAQAVVDADKLGNQCSKCGALPHKPCVTPKGKPTRPHKARKPLPKATEGDAKDETPTPVVDDKPTPSEPSPVIDEQKAAAAKLLEMCREAVLPEVKDDAADESVSPEEDAKTAALKKHVAKRRAEREAKRAAEAAPVDDKPTPSKRKQKRDADKAEEARILAILNDDKPEGNPAPTFDQDNPTVEDRKLAYHEGVQAAGDPEKDECRYSTGPLLTLWHKGRNDEFTRLEAELDAEEQVRLEAEEQARLDAEEQARLEAEEQELLKDADDVSEDVVYDDMHNDDVDSFDYGANAGDVADANEECEEEEEAMLF